MTEARELFERHLDLIEKISRAAARQSRLQDEDAEDFRQDVYVKLMEDDYRRVRSFQGKSSLETYLAVVIARLMQDFRNARWGKWRPSAAAKRLGSDAVRLERLLERDRMPLRDALASLERESGQRLSSQDVLDLYRRLPMRLRIELVGLDDVAKHRSVGSGTTTPMEVDQVTYARAMKQMNAQIETLPAEDRLIMRLRFFEGSRVSDIARGLGIEAGPLYKRIRKNCRTIRDAMTAAGFERDDFFD